MRVECSTVSLELCIDTIRELLSASLAVVSVRTVLSRRILLFAQTTSLTIGNSTNLIVAFDLDFPSYFDLEPKTLLRFWYHGEVEIISLLYFIIIILGAHC